MRIIGDRLRFSLRTAFIVVTVLAVILAIWSIRERQISAATNAIGRFGGNVFLNADCDDAGVPLGPFEQDRTLLGKVAYVWKSRISPLRTICAVELGGRPINGSDLTVLKMTPDVECLNLRNTNVGDDGIPILIQLQYLRFIDLSGSKITPGGAEAIRQHNPAIVISDDFEFKALEQIISSWPDGSNGNSTLNQNPDVHEPVPR